ncbi:MAG: AAA family ATPase, partial [Elainellaceae cyanobacterium]
MAFSSSAHAESIPDVLPGITLNRQQWDALKQLEEFLGSTRKLHLLTGYAGTGKTTLLQALIKRLRDRSDRRPIVLTAHSNKATKVLNDMAERWKLDVNCMTCCKLLGLKPEIDTATGKQIFKPDRQGESLFDRYRLVIVDEASMISEDMWQLLTTAVSDLHKQTQVLFVGDVAQLPPVGERESKVFSQIYDRSDLTEVVRYGGAIGILAESVRNNLDRHRLPVFATDANESMTEGVLILNGAAWERCLLKAFGSEACQSDPDYVRVLAYTNKRVDQLNRCIREALHGADRPRFVTGDRLIANTPCLIDDHIALQNSSECEVLDAEEGHQGHWQVWFLSVLTDDERYRTLTVLHEQSEFEFKRKLQL